MLVLTRKLGEEIRIGDEITITVLLTGKNRVKLGISGPQEIPVVRAELSSKVQPVGRGFSPLDHRVALGDFDVRRRTNGSAIQRRG